MGRTHSVAEIAAEAECPEERVRWMTAIGMTSALLDTGVPAESIEHAAIEGLLKFFTPGPEAS